MSGTANAPISADALLPPHARRLFWDRDLSLITWPDDRDLITQRILTHGTWADMAWLRSMLGDDGVRVYLMRTGARGVPRPRIYHWQAVLDLPDDMVSRWVNTPERQLWDSR